ncbi:MAG TPA: hypothetical protein VMY37_20110 [Thermoguttaceae bacterium]|nr:hypothetical protein [Thermoguttaceae bacterium]HUU97731.1 hypothetical protein [Phycisphaerae bacterium]
MTDRLKTCLAETEKMLTAQTPAREMNTVTGAVKMRLPSSPYELRTRGLANQRAIMEAQVAILERLDKIEEKIETPVYEARFG